MTAASPNLDALLAQSAWAHSLARELVRDPDQADDLVQQGFLEALRRLPGDRIASPRAWLGRVLRHRAVDEARSDRQRRRREAALARPEASEAADPAGSSAHRVRVQRDLANAVLALEEPYREVITLRFFDAVPPRTIAKRLGRPVETVRTQIKRGLDQLRGQLDTDYGDRDAWCAALLPLVGAGAPATVGSSTLVALGGALMTWKVLVPLVGASLAAFFWFDRATPSAAPPVPVPPTDVATLRAEPNLATPREAIATTPTTAEPRATELRGRVLDLDGVPVAGVELWLRDPSLPRFDASTGTVSWPVGTTRQAVPLFDGSPELSAAIRAAEGEPVLRQILPAALAPYSESLHAELRGTPPGPRTRTDATGAFAIRAAFAADAVDLRVLAVDRAAYAASTDDTTEVRLLVGPIGELHGRVVDQHGAPVHIAEVELELSLDELADRVGTALGGRPFALARGLRDFFDYKRKREWQVETAADGAFALAGVPTDGPALSARKAGFDSTERTLRGPQAGGPLVLRRRPVVPPDLTGVVRHGDGRVAPGAHVAFGRHRTTADTGGQFALTAKDWQPDSALVAYTEGAQMARIEDLGPRLDRDREAGRGLVLVLGPEPLEIRGRVVEADGAPAEGWQIHLLDGATSDHLAWAEHVIAATATLAPTTGADGTFRVGGLSDRAYRLRAIHDETLLTLDSQPLVAGTVDAELRIPEDALHAELEGIVLDREGLPVDGARVVSVLELSRPALGVGQNLTARSTARTDARGRFTLRDVPRRGATIQVQGSAVGATNASIQLDPRVALPVMVTVDRLRRVRIAIDAGWPDQRTHIGFVDAAGAPLQITVQTETYSMQGERLTLTDVADHEMRVPSAAVAAAFYGHWRDGNPLHRIPLQQVPEQTLRLGR
ncbi:MAG: sigma-70 family RNA polymerase sigma factor [Planctomycetota bacterium]